MPAGSAAPPIAHEDFVYALSQIDSFIDVSEQDLLRIYDVAPTALSLFGVEPISGNQGRVIQW